MNNLKTIVKSPNSKIYNNCFKFKCMQSESLNDMIIRDIEVLCGLSDSLIVSVSPLVKTNVSEMLKVLSDNVVDIKIELTDEEGNTIEEILNGKYELRSYKYVLSHTRICSDNQPLCIELEFKEV